MFISMKPYTFVERYKICVDLRHQFLLTLYEIQTKSQIHMLLILSLFYSSCRTLISAIFTPFWFEVIFTLICLTNEWIWEVFIHPSYPAFIYERSLKSSKCFLFRREKLWLCFFRIIPLHASFQKTSCPHFFEMRLFVRDCNRICSVLTLSSLSLSTVSVNSVKHLFRF